MKKKILVQFLEQKNKISAIHNKAIHIQVVKILQYKINKIKDKR